MYSIKITELIGEFLDSGCVSRSLSQNTLAAYRQDLNEFSTFIKEDQDIRSVGPETLKEYLRRLRTERALSPATIRRRIACLKSFFRWARQEQHVDTSPFDETSIVIRLPRRLPRALSRQEISKLAGIWSAKGWATEHGFDEGDATSYTTTTYLAVHLMLATGVRVGELLAMRLPDVDDSCTVIRIYGKGSKERTVFLTNEKVRGYFAAYIAARQKLATGDNFVLRNTRNMPLTPQALRLRLRKLGEKLSIKTHLTPHRFRHTAATLLIEEGVDIRFVQKLLGHSSISTTEIYTHVTDESLRLALSRADPLGKFVS